MFAREMLSVLGPGAANAVNGSVAATFTAAGTTQATATAITCVTTNVTSGSEGNGALLPASMQAGDSGKICNTLTVDILVYPTSGGQINGAAANKPLTLGANRACTFVYVTGSNVIMTF